MRLRILRVAIVLLVVTSALAATPYIENSNSSLFLGGTDVEIEHELYVKDVILSDSQIMLSAVANQLSQTMTLLNQTRSDLLKAQSQLALLNSNPSTNNNATCSCAVSNADLKPLVTSWSCWKSCSVSNCDAGIGMQTRQPSFGLNITDQRPCTAACFPPGLFAGNFSAQYVSALNTTIQQQVCTDSTETITLIPTGQPYTAGSTNYVGSVMGVTGAIYLLPQHWLPVLKINIVNDTVTPLSYAYTSFGDSSAYLWSGGALAPNGIIYLCPYNSGSILKINTINDSITYFPHGKSGIWDGGVLSPAGKIYCMSATSPYILKIDPTTQIVSYVGSITPISLGWAGGILAPNGIIYGSARNARALLRVNPSTDTVTQIALTPPISTVSWRQGASAWTGIIYFAPSAGGYILKLNPQSEIISFLLITANNAPSSYTSFILAGNGMLYSPGVSPVGCLRVNPFNDQMAVIPSLQTSSSTWVGATFSMLGSIYAATYTGTDIMKINVTTLQTLPLDALLAPYRNNG